MSWDTRPLGRLGPTMLLTRRGVQSSMYRRCWSGQRVLWMFADTRKVSKTRRRDVVDCIRQSVARDGLHRVRILPFVGSPENGPITQIATLMIRHAMPLQRQRLTRLTRSSSLGSLVETFELRTAIANRPGHGWANQTHRQVLSWHEIDTSGFLHYLQATTWARSRCTSTTKSCTAALRSPMMTTGDPGCFSILHPGAALQVDGLTCIQPTFVQR